MTDQQLEDLDLVTFVLFNLEEGQDSDTLELNNNHQVELVSDTVILNQEFLSILSQLL